MFDGGFGAAGEAVVIEEFMTGEEMSFFAWSTARRAAVRLGTGPQARRQGRTPAQYRRHGRL